MRILIIAATLALGACATHNAAQQTKPVVAQNSASEAARCAPIASRLPQRDCGPGRTYSQQDLQSTGQTNPAQALQMLDPAITGH